MGTRWPPHRAGSRSEPNGTVHGMSRRDASPTPPLPSPKILVGCCGCCAAITTWLIGWTCTFGPCTMRGGGCTPDEPVGGGGGTPFAVFGPKLGRLGRAGIDASPRPLPNCGFLRPLHRLLGMKLGESVGLMPPAAAQRVLLGHTLCVSSARSHRRASRPTMRFCSHGVRARKEEASFLGGGGAKAARGEAGSLVAAQEPEGVQAAGARQPRIQTGAHDRMMASPLTRAASRGTLLSLSHLA